MSTYGQNEFSSITAPAVASVSIPDRLALIDAAYNANDRTTCARMIEDLYALFDQRS